MVIEQEERTQVEFNGSGSEKKIAERVYDLLRARGRFMSADVPIRASMASIAEFLTVQGDTAAAKRLEATIAANPAVFAVEEGEDGPIVVTTRAGTAPSDRQRTSPHTFTRRFMTPLPKPERPPMPVRERARIDPSWATLPAILGDFEDDDETDLDLVAEVDAAVPEPEIEATSAAIVESPRPVVGVPAAEATVAAPPAVADLPAAQTPPAAEAEVVPEPAPLAPPARTITLPTIVPTDVTGVDDVDLASVIRQRLQADPRIANFGEQWMMEDRVPRFSRGDLRRFKDYLQEQEQPLPDDVLVQDVLGIRPSTPDFDAMRFAVNFRLSREHREFEFVGTSNQRFWSTTGLPQIGTTRRKPNEIGSDYRYLLEESPAEPVYHSATDATHVLTFYEYIHGLLPYDADMQALLPGPVVPNQKSAVLTFESPQSYTTYLVELRFPTPNRGGFILGLDDLYAENLVPGAVLSIGRTDNDGHYLVEYVPESGQNARLLEIDERRAQRYVFRPTTYACGVEEEMLLTEERFGRLAGEKPLDEKVRRRPEAVVAATFERVGDNREANFSADFATLLAGVNVERPMSATLLKTILEQDDSGAFSRDPDKSDAYTYVPGTTP